jgi:NhaP-type Na+/H+ or K+/H+ antiporter
VFITAFAPKVLASKPISMSILLLGLGFIAFSLPFVTDRPDPVAESYVTKRITELGVIVALMGAGLKLDRPFAWREWRVTWRLLAITMPLTIGAVALLGWGLAGFIPATAMLLGAVISPTDPVLATEVQVGAPQAGSGDPESGEHDPSDPGEEDEVRFGLTSEAGLNDGLAFPYTNAAVAMATAGAHPSNWIGMWLLIDVAFKLGVGFLVGLVAGRALAEVIFRLPAKTETARSMIGIAALGSTLVIYGLTELLGGYGFIATFVGAASIRAYERDHDYQGALHGFSEKIERLLTAAILVLLGGAIAGGILSPLDVRLVVMGLLIVFVVRPIAGGLGLFGYERCGPRERLAISFFGIRGIGSIYYLAYALERTEFEGEAEVWAVVAFVVMVSVLVHGVTAAPVMERLDKLREARASSHA